jgi:hypothetical protein
MQCRGLNCNPTFVRGDIIGIGRLRPPMLLFVSISAQTRTAGGRSTVQKIGAGLTVAIRPVRIA